MWLSALTTAEPASRRATISLLPPPVKGFSTPSLAGSAVVKALNHIGYHELEDRARSAGAPDRRAVGVAGDDPAAVAAVADLTDRIGYDPVRLGRLRAGRVLQPGGPVFGQVLTLPEFERAVHEDARSVR